MINIKIKATGEIKSVTPNVAHDLIDKGIAEVSKGNKYNTRKQSSYINRQMVSVRGKSKSNFKNRRVSPKK